MRPMKNVDRPRGIQFALLAVVMTITAGSAFAESPVADGAKAEEVATGFIFTEGPARNAEGDLFFSDVVRAKVFKLTADGELTTFLEKSGGTNGLYFDADGNLLGCQRGSKAIVSISPEGEITTVVDAYDGKALNSTNDLWIDPRGGIYFTDPRYFGSDNKEQDAEAVYYITPDRESVIRVEADLTRPNGVVGTEDGKTLYVADHADGKTWRYAIAEDGTLTDRTLFVEQGSDGLTLDERGNLYLTGAGVDIYSPEGEHLDTIEVEVQPTNVRFAGPDRKTLYITARTRVYAVPMKVRGL